MPAPLTPALLVLVLLNLIFAYFSGIADTANIVAPVISSRAIRPQFAVLLAAGAALAAPLLFGVAVARTFGVGVLLPAAAGPHTVLAATFSATLWRLITWWWNVPASSSHGVVGGLVGAGLAAGGLPAVNLEGLGRVLLALFVSPLAGLLAGFIITGLLYALAERATPRINNLFRLSQVFTALVLALSWGANDAQKAIGLLALGVAAVTGASFDIPLWVSVAAMGATALGGLTGGSRLIRKLGGKFYRIRPIHGLAAQLAAAGVSFAATAVGAPVSTTQVVSTTILGAGAAQRLNMVRWGVAAEIVWAWVLTVPATVALGALGVWALRWLPFFA
ncbi:MAG: inorganic phosphate transporter [Anaerolineales bacterium]|nr:inorganic phosphate transporter [Anaerolineales bacterium]